MCWELSCPYLWVGGKIGSANGFRTREDDVQTSVPTYFRFFAWSLQTEVNQIP